MKFKGLQQIASYSKKRKRRKHWRMVVTFLAAVVVFCTAYALLLPAITKERQRFCGLEEHVHTDACWQPASKVLSCDFTSNEANIIHTHTKLCYDLQGNLVCRIVQMQPHTHDASCYAEPELICALEENEEHQHEQGCYGEADLICTLPQTLMHIHSSACWDAEGSLICQVPGLIEHLHDESCFTVSEPLLICKLQEHTHSEACYIDRTADIETAEMWEATLPEELDGQWSQDALTIAISQLGYRESEVNALINDEGVKKGYTRYGAWFGDEYGDWCAMFVSFCLNYAEVDREFFPFEASCPRWVEKLEEEELYFPAEGHVIKPGDLIFFDYEDDDNANHVGLVVEIIPEDEENPAQIKTIEGNRSDSVDYGQYYVTDETILGFADVSIAQKKYELTQPFTKTYSDENVFVEATYLGSALIPEEAELKVTWLVPETMSDYDSYYNRAQELLDQYGNDVSEIIIKDFKLYDISFILNGEEIEPADAVDIQIRIPQVQLSDSESVTVIHYAEDGTEIPPDQQYTVDSQGVLNTAFETESFSLFAVVTTQSDVKSIIAMSYYSITNANVTALNGRTFAIAAGNYALAVKQGNLLGTKELLSLTDTSKTGDEALLCWSFEKNTTNTYYITTIQNEMTYYLSCTNDTLSLTTDQSAATAFTATRSGTNLTLANSRKYINLGASGVSMNSSAALSLYVIPSGEFTATFDGRIGNAAYWMNSGQSQTYKFTESETFDRTTVNGYITLPTASEVKKPGNYPMKLNGWYDIINKVFYDSSMLGQKIRLTNDTIFYPEWIAETYDIGQNVDVVQGQPDTSDFINTYVYDYTELFNTHSANYDTSSKTWKFDANSELGFIFFDYLTTGNIGNIADKNTAVNGVTVNEEKTKGTRGSSTTFPGTITSGIANDARMEALFGTTPYAGRHALGEADWLYSYDSTTGFYYYNSARNAASYNQSEQRFYVYDYVVNIDSQNSLNDFLPFNYGPSPTYGTLNETNDEGATVKYKYAEKDNEANYWFGMKSEIEFFLPADSGSAYNVSSYGTDMQLRFSGDDDVWIFIDGELVLDLGGVHDVVYGEVNFATGKVTIGQALSSSAIADDTAETYAEMPGVVYNSAGVTTTDLPFVLEGGKMHTITIYYLERGSSLSNCAVYFNLSPAYDLLISKMDSTMQEMLAGAVFQVYDDEECTTPSVLYVIEEDGTRVESADATFTTGEDGTVRCWGLLPSRTYYIKEIEPPPGYPQVSDYVIKIDLNAAGDAVIEIDSNGQKHKFAQYHTTTSEAEHLVELDVYNNKFVGGTEEIYVEKVWEGATEALPDKISVQLYANGEPTDRIMELREDNNWQGMWYNLPTCDENNVEYDYSVVEVDIPSDYTASYEEIIAQETNTTVIPGYWEEVTSLSGGAEYRIVSTSTGYAVSLASSSSSSLKPVAASETDESQCWIATASGSGVILQNKAYPSRYLSLARYSASATTSSTGNNVIISLSGGKISSAGGGYLRDNGSTNFQATSYSSWASNYRVYKWHEPSTETTVIEKPGWRVTNKPWDGKLNIPVQKVWDATLYEEEWQEVQMKLYLVSDVNSSAILIKTLTLNANNDWQGSFDDLSRPSDGSFYCIVEDTDEYIIDYGENTVSVFIGDKRKDAAKVTFEEDGTVTTVQITNSFLALLPETGGIGIQWYTLGGMLIVAVSIFLLYRKQKRRKEDFASS